MADQPPLTLGQRVVVMGKRKGIVRFNGPTDYGPGEWVGVELDKPSGTHDGGAHGKRYFTCNSNHGVYVQRQGVQLVQSWGAAASQIQSLLRGRKDRQESEYKRAFHTWHQMEMQDESDHLTQTAQISRVEQMLRAYHPASSPQPQGNSAVALSIAAGVSTNPKEWGEEIKIDSSYTGPHLTWPVTLEQVKKVLHHVRTRPHEPLHLKYVMQLVGRSVRLFNESLKSSICDINVPACEDGKLVILGDTHGQLADFLWVLKQNGEPSLSTGYLLNGDVVDRGEHACEILIITLLYKQLYPDFVTINRGNHENIEMNRRSFENGGGFFDEVKQKYDANLFMMFAQLFEVLPIATVISGKVFVVHGGLYRREGVKVQHLRTINRRRQCPTNTDNIEDALFFDCMWADPWDFPGVAKAANRGANCIRFGPDVTKRFLGTNALSLCIRSHEVPSSLRGFEDRHDGRLITVFTASNYCGQTGNFGAVVIFHADMSYTVEEHMAPPLASLSAEYLKPGEEPAYISPTPEEGRSGESKEEYREKMEQDNLAKLESLVVKHKDDLWWYWTHVDVDNTCKIPTALWRQGMASCLQLDLPWFSLQKHLVQVDKDGNVNYKHFLERCRPQVDNEKAFEAGWEYKVVHKAYEAMLNTDLALKRIIELFDSDGDGLVSPQEFKQALQAANIGLPETQINAILRVIERDDQGKLDVRTFLDRFQVVYSAGQKAGGAEQHPETKENMDLLNKVGNKLMREGSSSRMQVFQTIDINNDGYLNSQEFHAALDKLDLGLTDSQKAKVWSAVDINSDGHLNYLEFCAAFQVVDTSDFSSTAVREIMEAVLSALQQNKDSLNYSFRYFDPENKGKVKTSDFMAGLRALNASLGGGRAPFSDEQLEVLVEFVDTDKDGYIEYAEFLSAFATKQTASEDFDLQRPHISKKKIECPQDSSEMEQKKNHAVVCEKAHTLILP